MLRNVVLHHFGYQNKMLQAKMLQNLFLNPHWVEIVMVACAETYHDHIAHKIKENRYRTVMRVTSPLQREHRKLQELMV